MLSDNKDKKFDTTLNQKLDQDDLLQNSINSKREPLYKNIFNRFLSKFRNEEILNARETLKEYSYEYSKFREYIFLLEDSEDDEKVLKVIELCDDSLKLDRHKIYLNKKIREYEITLEDLKCYENLSEEDAENLKLLITKFIQINNERKNIRYQLGDFNDSINKLETLEEDANDALYQIEDAENSKRLLSRDISLIKDEKERTATDRDKLKFAYKLLYKFSFAISLILGISITVLALVSISLNESMFLPLSILCITLIFIITLIYTFRRKIIFELKLNHKKQTKLIGLLNKKTVVYSYYINFLDYAYNKYNVKNSRVLKANLEDFNNYKHIITRYDNLGKIAFETQKKLEEFLKEKDIKISNNSLESFAKSINIDNKISFVRDINTKREKILKRLKEIEEEQQGLMDEIIQLNINDTSKEKVIEKIIQAYFNETEKISLEKDIENIEPDI